MIFYIRLYFALLFANCARLTSRILSKGSGEQIYGRILDALCKDALGYYARDKKIIVVSATNGKTTTTRLIAQGLSEKYPYVITNALGANQRAGIVSALAQGTKQQPDSDSQYCVLEVDERSLKTVIDELNPFMFVLLNLSRDQMDRVGEITSIRNEWKKNFNSSSARFIANGSDPNIVGALVDVEEKNKTFLSTNLDWHEDAYICPECLSLLTWDSSSQYACKSCSFATPSSIEVFDESKTNNIENHLIIPGRYNIANAMFAYKALEYCDVNEKSILKAFSTVQDVSGRNAIYESNDRSVQLFLAKNPAGWNETIKHISKDPSSGLIFAFNCNTADGKDPSWLYDVRFEQLAQNDVIIFGQRATDINVRLNIADKKTSVVDNIEEALKATSNYKHTNIIASYTQFFPLSKLLSKIEL